MTVLALSLLLPVRGSWTIDDGVKRIAAENGQGFWRERLADDSLRARLPEPADFPALHPPFAERVNGGFLFGFSPWSRLLTRGTLAVGEHFYRFAPALTAVLLWIVLEAAGIPFAFLLLPLTFYALVPWEHGLSWLLAWPSIGLTLNGQHKTATLFVSGLLLGLAVALRPETAVLALVLGAYWGYQVWLKRARFSSGAWWMLGIAASVIGLVLWHAFTSAESPWIQLRLNLSGNVSNNGLEWLNTRLTAVYGSLLRMDGNGWMSALLIAGLIVGVLLLHRGENKKAPVWWGLGLMLALAAIGLQTYRLWSSPLPPLTLLTANSLIAACPWVLLSALPPYRGRNALLLAAVSVTLVILISPVWEGVHWGPRLLLFVLPLLLVDLVQTERHRTRLFAALIVLSLVPAASSAVLVWARGTETAERARLVEPYLGSVVICPTMSLCADLAPLWPGREFFTAADPRELRQLLIGMRAAGVDTAWLHLDAKDPLYVKTFPDAKPVRPSLMVVTQGRTLYRTFWRTYELLLNRGDSSWAEILETEAGRLLLDNRPEDALRLQEEAMRMTSNSAPGCSNLALIYSALGKTDEARAAAMTALTLDSSLAEPKRLLEILSSRAAGVP